MVGRGRDTVATLLRVSWRTVSGIVGRVVAELAGRADRLGGLRRIGIDGIACRKGHRYLTVVVDHDTGRLVWAREGRNRDVMGRSSTTSGPNAART